MSRFISVNQTSFGNINPEAYYFRKQRWKLAQHEPLTTSRYKRLIIQRLNSSDGISHAKLCTEPHITDRVSKADFSDHWNFHTQLITLRTMLRQTFTQFVLYSDVIGLIRGQLNKKQSEIINRATVVNN